jgi:hypothetical protein|nr:hypothetical protein [Neorhizobium tomejilense]
MKILTLSTLLAVPLALASCISTDYDSRYGSSGGYSGTVESSFAHTGGMPSPEPQRTGWFTSPQVREAERKSIARDIPHGVVNPLGTVVYN